MTVFKGDIQVEGQKSTPHYTITYSATINPDFSNGNSQEVTLTGDPSFDTPSNMKAGTLYIILIKQDATGGRSPSWSSDYHFKNDTQPTLSSGANDVDALFGFSDGTTFYCWLETNFDNTPPA